ncbi:MAG: DUF423 domain-containing protein [Deltaproteobacteria bacterium]|nr:MAG: DUF423 domain-containing protein [Deltaproteobacteria bacterium]
MTAPADPPTAPSLSPWWRAAGVLGALGVALGAFGAHGLRNLIEDPQLLVTWETAARYHVFHALALGLVAAHPARPHRAGWLLLTGTVIFSGSLYLLVLSGVRWLGAITPLGGAALIAGWLILGFSTLRRTDA